MNDNWLQHPMNAMHAPLQGDPLDALGQMLQPAMPQQEPEATEAQAKALMQKAAMQKALSQKMQLAIAAKNDAALKTQV